MTIGNLKQEDKFNASLRFFEFKKTLSKQKIMVQAFNQLGGFSDPTVNFITYEIIKPLNFPPYFTGNLVKKVNINIATLKPN
jgi:hypothetical protein